MPLANPSSIWELALAMTDGNAPLATDGAMDDFIAQRTKQHTTRAWWRLPLYSLFIATSVAVVVSALKKKGKKKKGGNKQHRAS